MAELCRKRCERLRSQCNERLADNCQANCKSYVGLAQTCEARVREALTCAAEAQDLICADVAPQSCEKAFKKVAGCGSGTTSEEPATTEALKLPGGWRVAHDSALGFRVPLPAGAERKSEGQRRFLSVTDAAGNRYFAGVEPALSPEVNDKTLLRSVRSFVLPCELNLRLHGRYETNGVTAVRFEAGCTDGSAWHGMLRIAGDKMYPVAVKSAPGQNPGPELESMIYGFELDKSPR